MTQGGTNTDNPEGFPPPLVTETLQYRLETGNIAKQGGQRGSLTRCAQKFGIFQSHWLAPQPDAEAIESSKQDLTQDLEYFKLELYKLLLLQKNLDAQVQMNQKAEQERQAEIEKWSQDVQASQSEASHALETKLCFMEYEAFAKMTNEKHPQSIRALKDQLAKVQTEIQRYQAEEGVTDHLLKVRGAQFQLLIQYMMDLKRSLNDSEEQEKLLELAKQSNAQSDSGDGTTKKGGKPSESMDVDEDEGLYEDLI